MIARIVIAVVFLAVMGLVVRPGAHFVVDNGGWLGALAALAGIFALGIAIENRDRAAEGRPRYSAYDAGRDVRELVPIAAFWGAFVLIIFVLTRFI